MIPEDDRAGRDSGSFRGCPDRLSDRTGDGPAFCSAVIFERALTGSVGHGKAAVGGGHGGGISGTSSREWHYSRVFTVVTMRIWATRGLVLASLAVVFVGAIPCSRPDKNDGPRRKATGPRGTPVTSKSFGPDRRDRSAGWRLPPRAITRDRSCRLGHVETNADVATASPGCLFRARPSRVTFSESSR